MPAVLKSAVIGTGVISKQHLAFLQTCAKADLVGVCDLSLAAVNYAVETYGIGQLAAGKPDGGSPAIAYTDYAKMLEVARPDVVHILTPPKTCFGR